MEPCEVESVEKMNMRGDCSSWYMLDVTKPFDDLVADVMEICYAHE